MYFKTCISKRNKVYLTFYVNVFCLKLKKVNFLQIIVRIILEYEEKLLQISR
jgi:hypothetical protein